MTDDAPSLTPDRLRRIAGIFEVALELGPDLRKPYLDALAAEDGDLKRRVLELLADAEGSHGVTRAEGRQSAGELSNLESIGPWRLLEHLGQGGMGDVFLAERADAQYDRQVAIKLIRKGIDSFEGHQRFLAERQILAAFDHPNIARLFDGGTADGERPYLVMEYVDGVRIDRYCDEKALSVKARLELFLQVCDAVEYAHKNLVIHRDLKPSNVLVTADGTVKLLDFGIAKLLSPRFAGLSGDLTVTGAHPLTPNFASPEQLRGEPLDTRSDVYSLGALLYVLLTGGPPNDLTGSTPGEWPALLESRTPTRPSARFETPHRPAAPKGGEGNAETRPLPSFDEGPATVRRQLLGDVDTLVLKALHREKNRRYGSANLLSRDLRRHLKGLPIEARADSFVYRAQRFVQRHWPGVTAFAAAFVMVSTLAVVATLQAKRADRERLLALEAQQRAEAARDVEREVGRFLVEAFGINNANLPARELLQAQAETLGPGLVPNPVALARIQEMVGAAFGMMDLSDLGEPFIDSAIQSLESLDGDLGLELAQAKGSLAEIYIRQRRLEEAEVTLDESRALLDRYPPSATQGTTLATNRYKRGWLRTSQGRSQDVLEVLQPLLE
ncbi:MAG: serine/threonine-protein kinase, partial [Acidobacteriota bacterium]